MATSYHDSDHVPVLMAVSSADGKTPVIVWADPVTHRLLTTAAGGGTMTKYDVSGTINSSNKTFTIPVAVTSDFILVLVNQFQMLGIDYTYSAGVGTTTITMTTAPDASLSGLGFQAYVTT
jgi:hypothetical protein